MKPLIGAGGFFVTAGFCSGLEGIFGLAVYIHCQPSEMHTPIWLCSPSPNAVDIVPAWSYHSDTRRFSFA